MRRLGILVIGAALALGCGPARRSWVPQRTPAGEAPSAFAVVRASTPLHVVPDRRAATVSLPAEGFVPMRILRERDGWAYLETLGEPADRHCVEGLPRLEPYRLRLFAPISTLVPVTSRELSQRFDDDTSFALSRGVPVERVQGELWRAHLGDVSTIVRASASDVSTRYLPSPPVERAATDRLLSRDALRASVPILGQTGRLTGDAALPVYARDDRGTESVVEVRARCARFRVRVPAHTVIERPAGPDGLLAELSSTARSEPAHVAPRSPVFWANEQPAGVVVAPAPLGEELDSVGGRRCFSQLLDEGHTSVILCFRPRDIIEPGAGAARRLDAPA